MLSAGPLLHQLIYWAIKTLFFAECEGLLRLARRRATKEAYRVEGQNNGAGKRIKDRQQRQKPDRVVVLETATALLVVNVRRLVNQIDRSRHVGQIEQYADEGNDEFFSFALVT